MQVICVNEGEEKPQLGRVAVKVQLVTLYYTISFPLLSAPAAQLKVNDKTGMSHTHLLTLPTNTVNPYLSKNKKSFFSAFTYICTPLSLSWHLLHSQ